MQIIQENLWQYVPGGLIAVTTNASIKYNGALVMGRGAAKEAVQRIRDIDLEAGTAIAYAGPMYGFLPLRMPEEKKMGFGIFQVKKAWNEKAHVKLILNAVMKLREFALEHPEMPIRLNYPGIGNGGLTMDEVEPYLVHLDECANVMICYK